MTELKPRIHDDRNGLDYVLCGDYYIPALTLETSSDHRDIGRWGRMHRDFIREHKPSLYSQLLLEGKLHSYLADLNEQVQTRRERMIDRLVKCEGVTEDLKRREAMEWVRRMNSIASRVDEVIRAELIYAE